MEGVFLRGRLCLSGSAKSGKRMCEYAGCSTVLQYEKAFCTVVLVAKAKVYGQNQLDVVRQNTGLTRCNTSMPPKLYHKPASMRGAETTQVTGSESGLAARQGSTRVAFQGMTKLQQKRRDGSERAACREAEKHRAAFHEVASPKQKHRGSGYFARTQGAGGRAQRGERRASFFFTVNARQHQNSSTA